MEDVILKIRTGSHLYGTAVDGSDEDIAGVFMPSFDNVMGLQKEEIVNLSTKKSSEERKNTEEDVDCTLFEFRRFCRLAMSCSPNIVEMLFVNDGNVISITEMGTYLCGVAPMFLHKGIKDKFVGYALSQQRKIEKENNLSNMKYGMHLIRLLYEGIELLETGNIVFPLKQASLLSDIRRGKYDKKDIILMSEDLIEVLRDAYNKTTLPEKPDFNMINSFVISAMTDHIKQFMPQEEQEQASGCSGCQSADRKSVV